jgi:hypothetical protein
MKHLPVGGHVEVLPPFATASDPWLIAEIIDLLDTQFTAEVPEYGVLFFFYTDRNSTWRQITETDLTTG